MEECWSGDPAARPLLGHVQPQLEKIMQRYCGQNGHAQEHLNGVEPTEPGTSHVNGSQVLALPFSTTDHDGCSSPATPMPVPVPSSTDFWQHVREV